MGSGWTVGTESAEPPSGWASATPYGAPWPHDAVPTALSWSRRPAPALVPGEQSAVPPQPAVRRDAVRGNAVRRDAVRRDREARAEWAGPGEGHHPVVLVARPHQDRPGADLPWPAGAVGRRRLAWAGICAAAVTAAAAVLALAVTARPGVPRSRAIAAHVLSLPSAVGGYRRGPHGLHETLTSADPFVLAPQTAVYQLSGQAGQAGGPLAGSIGIDVGHLRGVSPDAALSRIYKDFNAQIGKIAAAQTVQGLAPAGELAIAQTSTGPPQPAQAGPLGGRVSCWQVTGPGAAGFGPSAAASCVWADTDTFGFLLAPGLSTSKLAATLLMFRSAIEIHSR